MRTALGRARRLVTLLLLALSAWYLFLRRRVAPVAGHPAAGPAGPSRDELGAPGELPDDVLATDAGLTELPAAGAVDGPPADVLAAPVPAAAPAEVPDVPAPAEVLDVPVSAEVVDVPAPAEVVDVPAAAAPAEVVEVPGSAEPAEVVEVPAAVGPLGAGGGVGAPAAPGADDGASGLADAPTEQFPPGIEDGIEDPTNEIPRPEFAETPSPAFSDAPTMEMPVLMDDLRAVRGIGPSMERMLHGLGIVSFRQLALLDGAELERVRHELRDFRSRIEREDWIGQARQLHKAKYGTDPA